MGSHPSIGFPVYPGLQSQWFPSTCALAPQVGSCIKVHPAIGLPSYPASHTQCPSCLCACSPQVVPPPPCAETASGTVRSANVTENATTKTTKALIHRLIYYFSRVYEDIWSG